MANDQDKTGQQGGSTQNNPDGFRNGAHRPSEPEKQADRCRAGSPTWLGKVKPKVVARNQAAATKENIREQVMHLIKAVRVATPLGQNPSMTRATLTKLSRDRPNQTRHHPLQPE